MILDSERQRLAEDKDRRQNWKRWGPYLAERQWGTVREDYSADGSVWGYFTHDQARSRTYRWGEDGLLGFTDRQCRLCLSLALWNERDPILKERLFGLTGDEGNHGEDVKECYYYLDSTPTHSYCRALYKYPQNEFPYARLVHENKSRSRHQREFELADAGVFDGDRYFDVFVEYAKGSPDDILMRITICNRAPVEAPIHVIPMLWYRNTWSWGRTGEGYTSEPKLSLADLSTIQASHPTLGDFLWTSSPVDDAKGPLPIFTNNETNLSYLFGGTNTTPYTKDAFHNYIVNGQSSAVDPGCTGTKSGFHYKFSIPAHSSVTINLRLQPQTNKPEAVSGAPFDDVMRLRMSECEEFYRNLTPAATTKQEQAVLRQSYAGLLWSKQFYHYSVKDWLEGDPTQPSPPATRRKARNWDWSHLYNRDIISMPDKWEYPWYAAWDSAFHMVAFARIDPEFAKDQLLLFLREWYMHPNGQIPAQEFDFSQVNPPVHAWACWRVYKMTAQDGKKDRDFLKRAFNKLLVNFTWWINRKDVDGKNLFAGGFLGLDNIGIFDRGAPVPRGGTLEQADATAWMAFYCTTMLAIALELAPQEPAYEDLASKFFEHFVSITEAINHFNGGGLWDQLDGFYYDQLSIDGRGIPLRVRSLVGIIPLLAVDVLENSVMEKLPDFRKRFEWFLSHKPELARHIEQRVQHESVHDEDDELHDAPGKLYLLAVPSGERLSRMLQIVLDSNEFLSPYGVRSLSKIHEKYPYTVSIDNVGYSVDYCAGDSNTTYFGGNSNWRGPIWFPINYLLIEALEKLHFYYGTSLKVACPSGSNNYVTLREVAAELNDRLTKIFLLDSEGKRPCHGGDARYSKDPHWNELILFYEHFHGDNGGGVGASHQTGWTSLVGNCIEKSASRRKVAPEKNAAPAPKKRSRTKTSVISPGMVP